MLALRRPRVFIPAAVVLVVALIGLVAVKSRGTDSKPLRAREAAVNCPPLARADAVATKPGQAVSVDVLANDTDPDGDPLVFQILNSVGGTATIGDAGTPTDAGDDTLEFTPSDPPTDSATVEYQAFDPQGAFSNAILSVYVNPTAALPPGVQSESPDAPLPEGSGGGRGCDAPTSTTTTDEVTTGPVGPDTTGVTTTVADDGPDAGSSTVTTRRGRATSTTAKKTSARRTTTTAKASPKPTAPGPAATDPPRTTTSKPKPPPGPTTTVDYSSNPCVKDPKSQACTDWKNQQHPTTSAPPTRP